MEFLKWLVWTTIRTLGKNWIGVREILNGLAEIVIPGAREKRKRRK